MLVRFNDEREIPRNAALELHSRAPQRRAGWITLLNWRTWEQLSSHFVEPHVESIGADGHRVNQRGDEEVVAFRSKQQRAGVIEIVEKAVAEQASPLRRLRAEPPRHASGGAVPGVCYVQPGVHQSIAQRIGQYRVRKRELVEMDRARDRRAALPRKAQQSFRRCSPAACERTTRFAECSPENAAGRAD